MRIKYLFDGPRKGEFITLKKNANGFKLLVALNLVFGVIAVISCENGATRQDGGRAPEKENLSISDQNMRILSVPTPYNKLDDDSKKQIKENLEDVISRGGEKYLDQVCAIAQFILPVTEELINGKWTPKPWGNDTAAKCIEANRKISEEARSKMIQDIVSDLLKMTGPDKISKESSPKEMLIALENLEGINPILKGPETELESLMSEWANRNLNFVPQEQRNDFALRVFIFALTLQQKLAKKLLGE